MSDFVLEEREKNNPEMIARDIKMQWDTPAYDGKFLLLVEHDNDKRCYFKMFNPDKVAIKTSRGCNCMKRLFDAVQPYGIPNFAIQDSDFARVCGRQPREINYFLTDCHDHEMMCLSDIEVMKSIFINLAQLYDPALVSEVFDDLKMLSFFKWYNYDQRLMVNFRGYKARGKSKADLHSFAVIYSIVKPQSPKCAKVITETDIREFISRQISWNMFETTNGHDFLDLLSQYIGLKYRMPNLNSEHLRPIIYTSFTLNRFKNTQLYKDIYDWAGVDAPTLFAA